MTEKKNSAALKKYLLTPLISGLGGFVLIYILAQLEALLAQPEQAISVSLLAASFGASCVLVFAIPQSPLARPKNVIAGHCITAFVGLALLSLFPVAPLNPFNPLILALGVGLGIALMQATDTLHPPAGGNPLIVLLGAALGNPVNWWFLLTPILIGTIALVAVGWIYHRFISKRPYPV